MKIIRICDIRNKVELNENITGSIALSKVKFIFKLFNINTNQEVVFLKTTTRQKRSTLSELDILFKKHFNNPQLQYVEKINSIFNDLFHSDKLNITNENIMEIFKNINNYIKDNTEKTITILPGFYNLSQLKEKIGYEFNLNTGKVIINKPYIMRPSSSKSLESHGDLFEIISKANILGRYGEINIHLRELNSHYIINVPNKYLTPILYNLEIDGSKFFGEIIKKELTRLDFIPLHGETNELNFSFTDCNGKPLEINSEVSVELLAD